MSYVRLNQSVPDTFKPFYDFMEETGALSATQTHVLAIILNNIIDAKLNLLQPTDKVVDMNEMMSYVNDGRDNS